MKGKNKIRNNVKLKIGFHFALVVAITPFMTGCLCTSAIMDKSDKRTVDTFNPSAIYSQTTNHNSFALEGIRQNQNKKQFHAFLIIPEYLLASAQLQTNESLSLEEIKKMQIRKSENFRGSDLESEGRLPSSYEKIADLPKNDINIEIQEHHPDAAFALLLPLTVPVDIVGFPFEYCYMMSHSQYW